MQVLRPVLRRRLLSRPHLTSLRRRQTGGAHKEYFQNPGQAPVPDTTPYNPNEPIQAFPKVDTGPSWPVRAFRSVLWSTLFLTLGLGAGTGLITWEYLQPPFEQGSPEETELFEDIIDTLNAHPVAEDLRADNWVEEEFYALKPASDSEQGLNLIHDNLTGTRGLTIKAFRHPTLQYTILLAFAGFGVEGWPDVIHGGVTAGLMIEGAQRHLNNFYRDDLSEGLVLVKGATSWKINIDYRKPLRPGDVYAIVMPPIGVDSQPFGSTGGSVTLRCAALIMRLETAPRLNSSHDPVTGIQTNTLEVATSGGADVTHAIGTVEVTLPVDKDLAGNGGQMQAETAEDLLSALPGLGSSKPR